MLWAKALKTRARNDGLNVNVRDLKHKGFRMTDQLNSFYIYCRRISDRAADEQQERKATRPAKKLPTPKHQSKRHRRNTN